MFDIPVRVKIIAALQLVSALLLMLLGVVLFILHFSDNGWFNDGTCLVASVFCGLAAVGSAGLSYGLFKGRNWARLLTLGSAGVSLFMNLVTFGGWGGAVAGVYACFVIATLGFDDDVRRAFGG